jgi:hypothetical protein
VNEHIAGIAAAVEASAQAFPFERVDIIEHTRSIFKARLWLAGDLYIQLYANDKYPKRSFALISCDRRIYARDFMFGRWHAHNFENPHHHDTSPEGRRETSAAEFITSAVKLAIESSLY